MILDKIGPAKEKNIWKQGIRSWDDFLGRDKINGISKLNKMKYDAALKAAKNALSNYDSSFFISKLKSSEMWRLYDYFKDDAVFLDIEADKNNIFVITMFDGIDFKTMVKGKYFDKELFVNEINKHKIIVTFNGSSFDLPKLEKYYGMKINIPHVDLKHCCARIGLKGGLKEIEKKLNIKRNNILTQYKGNPIDLWKVWRATGDEYYLEKLVEYNQDDAYYLKPIMAKIYEKLVEKRLEIPVTFV